MCSYNNHTYKIKNFNVFLSVGIIRLDDTKTNEAIIYYILIILCDDFKKKKKNSKLVACLRIRKVNIINCSFFRFV